jgi:hypothetical protein
MFRPLLCHHQVYLTRYTFLKRLLRSYKFFFKIRDLGEVFVLSYEATLCWR